MELEDNCYTYVPARVSKALTKDESAFEALREQVETGDVHLRYLGGRYNLIEFVNINEQQQPDEDDQNGVEEQNAEGQNVEKQNNYV